MENERDVKIVDVVSLGQLEDTRELIRRGLDVDDPDENGNYAVTMAARRNDLEILKILIDAGAELNLFDGMGRKAITWARKYKNQEMIDEIEKAQPASIRKDIYRKTACKEFSSEAVEKEPAKKKLKPSSDTDPLMESSEKKEKIISSRGKPNQKRKGDLKKTREGCVPDDVDPAFETLLNKGPILGVFPREENKKLKRPSHPGSSNINSNKSDKNHKEKLTSKNRQR